MTNPGLDLMPQIHWIGRNGFDYVDLALEPPRADHGDVDSEALLEALKENRLGIIVHTSPYLPVANPHAAIREAARQEMIHALHFAEKVGSRLLTNHYLGGPSLVEKKAVKGFYIRMLEELCEAAENTGVRIAFENSPGNQDEPLVFREIFQQVSGAGLLLDLGHTHIHTRRDTVSDFLADEVVGMRLRHVHVSDNNGREDLHLPLGSVRGGVNWQETIDLLKGHGYDGTVTLEIFSPDRRDLLASRERFRQWWEGI
jgi:sugar phosphate isomerase/epimerase